MQQRGRRELRTTGISDRHPTPSASTAPAALRLHPLLLALVTGPLLGACASADERDRGTGASVMVAASLATPLRQALDSFARAEEIRIAWESGASLELARRVTELGREPALLALADADLFPQLLVPAEAPWYARFASARLVIAARSGIAAVDSLSWTEALSRPDVVVARADPTRAPIGYRTLLAWRLAALDRGDPALPRRLLARSPGSQTRPSEAEVVALLQTGAVDHAWLYESTARNAGLAYARIGDRLDFSTPAESASYARARLTVRAPGGDSLVAVGEPATYGLTVVPGPDALAGRRIAAFLLSPAGRLAMRRAGLAPLATPRLVGTVPAEVAAAATPTP